MKNLLLVLLLSSGVILPAFSQKTAKEVVKMMDEYSRGNSCEQEMKIEIIRPDWRKDIKVKLWSKGSDFGVMLITEPKRDVGVSYLKRGTEAWNWQPSIERVIKMPPSTLMQSWMGSDVNNDDLIKVSSLVVHYDHKFLNDTTIDGNECWVVELMPKEDAPVVWGKVILYISKTHKVKVLEKYFDEEEELVRNVLHHDIKKMGGKWMASWQEVIPADEPGNKTISRVLNIEWDKPINKNFFSLRSIKNLN